MIEISRLYKDGIRLKLLLNKGERKALTHIRDRSETAYQRERAAALLKIADGMSPHAVALSGLLRPRKADTVYRWVYAFDAVGLKSLSHAPRRHRDSLTEEEEQQLFVTITQQLPEKYSLSRSRWTLKALRDTLPFLKGIYRSLSGVWYLLQRLGYHYKRSRDVAPCPDPKKNEKIRRIRALLGLARKHPQKVVLLFVDEFSFFRQPLSGAAWWPVGRRQQPKAQRSCRSNTRGRIVAAVNAVSGEVTYQMADRINLSRFCDFLRHLKEVYGDSRQIYLVLDNWPTVHQHPKAFETFAKTGIRPAFTPTYSPESNPIELLWGKLSDEILRLHSLSDDWDTLKQGVSDWLSALGIASEETVKMIGLTATPAIRMNAA